jgi:hypothetical protein
MAGWEQTVISSATSLAGTGVVIYVLKTILTKINTMDQDIKNMPKEYVLREDCHRNLDHIQEKHKDLYDKVDDISRTG